MADRQPAFNHQAYRQLTRRCVASGARSGGVVLDPFSGSGPTGAAARMLGHDYIGIDLDPGCHEIAVQRLADLSDEVAYGTGP